jgi:hypothetical protein
VREKTRIFQDQFPSGRGKWRVYLNKMITDKRQKWFKIPLLGGVRGGFS